MPKALTVFVASLVRCSLATGALAAQQPSPSVGVGFGVDTTITDVRNVVSLVRAYLAKPDTSARTRGLWSKSTEFDRTIGDITAGRVNQGFPATIVGIIPAVPGDSVYVVRILYAHADSGRVSPLALQRLYAVREAGAPFAFRLSSAFPRVTTRWERRAKGPLTFWYVPGQRPNPARIERAARFVDSVAKLFSVPVPRHLDVVVGSSMDDVERAIGIDFFPEPSGPGQRSGGLNLGSVLLSGNPAIGEAYLHEFVHAVLGPTLRAGSVLLAEGVATWLGGSRGRTPREMYALLQRYQQSDPALTFSGLARSGFQLDDPDRASNLLYATGAWMRLPVELLSREAGRKRDRAFVGAVELGNQTNAPWGRCFVKLGVHAATIDLRIICAATRRSKVASHEHLPFAEESLIRVRPSSVANSGMGVLSDEMKSVIARQRLGFVATVCPDGTPNLSPKGTLSALDDDHLIFADLRSPGTVANLRVNPSVEVNVVDHFVRKGYRFKGEARVIDEGEELERLISFFARGILSDAPRRIRTVVVIRVDEARPLISPGYDSETDENSMRERWTRYYLGDEKDAV